MATPKQLQSAAHANSRAKGFWRDPICLGEKIGLIHSELSELLEAHRVDPTLPCNKSVALSMEQEEMADVLLRCLDLAEYKSVSLVHRVGLAPGVNVGKTISQLHAILAQLTLGTADLGDGLSQMVASLENLAISRGFSRDDLWTWARVKHDYNVTRPMNHGKRF